MVSTTKHKVSLSLFDLNIMACTLLHLILIFSHRNIKKCLCAQWSYVTHILCHASLLLWVIMWIYWWSFFNQTFKKYSITIINSTKLKKPGKVKNSNTTQFVKLIFCRNINEAKLSDTHHTNHLHQIIF